MSPLASPSERGAALRERNAQEQQAAQMRREQMAGRDRGPTGIVRGRLRTEEARTALSELNRKLDQAVDEVRVAFRREAQMAETDHMTRQDDAQRAPILANRKQVD